MTKKNYSILLNRIDQKSQSEHHSDSDTSSDLSLHNNDYKVYTLHVYHNKKTKFPVV
jgi:hypothetical protein